MLIVGDARFSMLYVDVAYMDVRALRRILELAQQGLRVCLKRKPLEPGKVKSGDYAALLKSLTSQRSVSDIFKQVVKHPPLIQGERIPEYWCRKEDDGTHYLFLAQWPSKDLVYPVYSGQSFMNHSVFSDLKFYINGKTIKKTIEFKPYQSVMLRISPKGKLDYMDIAFVPKDPVIRAREVQKTFF